jgi:phosphoglycolate phosphatase
MESMNKIEAVLFDLDGTLLDSFPDFLASLENMYIKSSSKKIDESVVRANVSDGSSKLLKLVFNIDKDDKDFDEHKRNFLNEYEKNILMYGNLFPGVPDLLNFLLEKKIPYGIVTNKPRKYTEIILKKSSLLRQSKVVICCDDGFKSKPNPEGINHASNILGVPNSKCIYIGDHENDLNSSLAAGTISGVCTFGYGFKKGLVVDGAESFESPTQILDFIKRNV